MQWIHPDFYLAVLARECDESLTRADRRRIAAAQSALRRDEERVILARNALRSALADTRASRHRLAELTAV